MAKKKASAKTRRKERKKVSAKRRVAEHRTGFQSTTYNVPDGVNMFKLKSEGVKRIDVLPFTAGKGNPFAEEGEDYYERTFWIHRGIGPNNDTYVCPRKTYGLPCPICDFRDAMRRKEDFDEDLYRDLAPKERQLFAVLDRADVEAGPQIWDVSYHLFGRRLDNEIQNQEEGEGLDLFADPEEGATLKLGIEEKSMGSTNFYAVEAVKFISRRDPIDEEILEKVPCLDDMLIAKPYDELKSIFLQEEMSKDESEDESEDEEEKPKAKKKKKKAPAKKKKPEPEPEEDDDEEDWNDDEGESSADDVDDGDDEPTPKSTGGKKGKASSRASSAKKKKPVEPEPEDEDDDWDDDEPAQKDESELDGDDGDDDWDDDDDWD